MKAHVKKNPFDRRFAFFLLPQKLLRYVLEIEFKVRVRITQPWTLRLRRRCDTSSSDDDNLDLGCRRSKKQLHPVHVSCSCSKTRARPSRLQLRSSTNRALPYPSENDYISTWFQMHLRSMECKIWWGNENTFSLTERHLRPKNYGFHQQLVK